MTDIAGLVERLEAATEGSDELDWAFTQWADPDAVRYSSAHLNYSWSIDAALSLVERKLGLDNETTFMYSFDFGWHASAHAPMAYTASLHLTVGTPPDMVTVDAQAPTLPLAVLIALLKALEQKATAP